MQVDSTSVEGTAPEPAPEPVDPLKEAEKKKELGNTSFRAKNFQEAIAFYTEAIGECATHGHAELTITRPA